MVIWRHTIGDSTARWRSSFALDPGRDQARWRPLCWPADARARIPLLARDRRPAAIDYALVWQPEPGLLASLPNLKMIVGLGAGVDHLLRDPDLPRHVPIVRLVDPYMTDAMSEYVALSVLRLHRQDLDYLAQQRPAVWREREQKNAAERPVGILGFGTLGQDAGPETARRSVSMSRAGAAPRSRCRVSRRIRRRGRARPPARTQRDRRLPAATDRRDARHPERHSLCADAARGGDRQCRARRPSGRGRSARVRSIRAVVRRGARCVRRRAAAAGHPFWRHPRIIVTPHVAAETHPPPPRRLSRDAIRAMRGRAADRQPGRSRARVIRVAVPARRRLCLAATRGGVPAPRPPSGIALGPDEAPSLAVASCAGSRRPERRVYAHEVAARVAPPRGRPHLAATGYRRAAQTREPSVEAAIHSNPSPRCPTWPRGPAQGRAGEGHRLRANASRSPSWLPPAPTGSRSCACGESRAISSAAVRQGPAAVISVPPGRTEAARRYRSSRPGHAACRRDSIRFTRP